MRGEQAIFNLEIKKKSGISLNPDIHHSKVPSSDDVNKFADNPIRSPQISGSSSYWLQNRTELRIKPVLKDTWLNYLFAAIH